MLFQVGQAKSGFVISSIPRSGCQGDHAERAKFAAPLLFALDCLHQFLERRFQMSLIMDKQDVLS